jgi:hypothetical protein
MPRARNLKHDFFMDDELSDHPPLARLFFEALWCLADYKGDIEWREKKLKAQTLPYDDCDIKEFAINLDKSRFIRFYSDGDKLYLNIRTFSDHQNPHKNEREKGSVIPRYTEELRQLIDLTALTINLDKSRVNRYENGTDPADPLFPITDSCSLIPDSLNLIPDSKHLSEKSDVSAKKKTYSDEFNQFWTAYPASRRGNKKRAYAEWQKIDADAGVVICDMQERHLTDRVFTEDDQKFVPHAERWLAGTRWETEGIPVSRLGKKTDNNIRVGLDWVENGV